MKRFCGTGLRYLRGTIASRTRAPQNLRRLSSARYAAAVAALNSLPEITESENARDPSTAYDLLERALAVVAPVGDQKLVVVAHSRLARHCYATGDSERERDHRIAAINVLESELSSASPGSGNGNDDQDLEFSQAQLCNAYNGLALSCLRVGTAESLVAAASAAMAAERHAVSAKQRLASSLHSALSRPPGSELQMMLLSAICGAGRTDLGDDGDSVASKSSPKDVDIVGYAKFFHGLLTPRDKSDEANQEALISLREVVQTWENEEKGFDVVEAQCATARELLLRAPSNDPGQVKKHQEEAEGLLTTAHSIAERIGNKIDVSEPLIGFAELSQSRESFVEAEGFYRSVEERFESAVQKNAFSVASAEVYCRSLAGFAQLLRRVGRVREAETKDEKAHQVKSLCPAILMHQPHVPMWFVESCTEQYEVPQPDY